MTARVAPTAAPATIAPTGAVSTAADPSAWVKLPADYFTPERCARRRSRTSRRATASSMSTFAPSGITAVRSHRA